MPKRSADYDYSRYHPIVPVRLPLDVREWLDRWADFAHTTRSKVIRKILDAAMVKMGEPGQPLQMGPLVPERSEGTVEEAGEN